MSEKIYSTGFNGNEIKPTELFHILRNQPVEAGDTLNGGSVVATLREHGLISTNMDGNYFITIKGLEVLEKIILNSERQGVFIETHVVIGK